MNTKTILLLIILSVNTILAERIQIYTENYPPYNMMENNKLSGFAVDIAREILNRIGSKKENSEIRLESWSRGYSLALKKKNNMIFSTTRTQHREKLFKWVGPISKTSIGLFAKKSKKIKIENIKDIQKYKVGAVLKDIGEQLLVQNDIEKKSIQSISGKDVINLSFKKLKNNRIDLFAYEINAAKYGARANGFDLSKYEVVYILKEGELFYAFNKNTDDKIIYKWQKALNDMKNDGTYNKIVSIYK